MGLRYNIHLVPQLSKDGGGYIASAPDFPLSAGAPCSQAETAAEALALLEARMAEWLARPEIYARYHSLLQ